jgi:hypothetical protein
MKTTLLSNKHVKFRGKLRPAKITESDFKKINDSFLTLSEFFKTKTVEELADIQAKGSFEMNGQTKKLTGTYKKALEYIQVNKAIEQYKQKEK